MTAPPTPALISRLRAWNWIDADPYGRPLPMLLVAHPPTGHPGESARSIDAAMRGLSRTLGLAPPHTPLPAIGPVLRPRHGSQVRLNVAAIGYGLLATVEPRWLTAATRRGHAVVAAALTPVPPWVMTGALDRKLRPALTSGRIHFGIAELTSSRKHFPPLPREHPPPHDR
ncbi:hypothetical protein [Peterkaempfera bronchialis]|nr:hypothetical protein [Peterkaempfera bronchialis]